MKNSDIISLFRGIGIIIDENIGNVDSHDNINKIVEVQVTEATTNSLSGKEIL